MKRRRRRWETFSSNSGKMKMENKGGIEAGDKKNMENRRGKRKMRSR